MKTAGVEIIVLIYIFSNKYILSSFAGIEILSKHKKGEDVVVSW